MSQGMHRILADGGEQVIGYTPEERADSTPAPTWALEDLFEDPDNADRVLASGAATVDTVSMPTSAYVGPRSAAPRTVEVPGGSFVAGRAYLLEDIETGESERVFVARTGISEIQLVAPVRGEFPAGSMLRGLHFSATVPAEVAADEELVDDDNPLQVIWTFYIGGRLRRVTELARVVRGTGQARYSVEIQKEIEEVWSELAAQLERNTMTLPAIIRHAERKVSSRLNASSIDPEKFLGGPNGYELLMARVLLHFADQGMYPAGRDPELFRTERRDEYVQTWNDLTTGTPGKNVVEKNRDDVADAPHSKRRRFVVDKA
jgi:hypothetical protein